MKQTLTLNRRLIVCLLLLFITANVHAQRRTKTILFIGNSYTYYNDLPNLLRQLALAGGDTLILDSHTPGGSTFQQHATDPTVLNKIQSRKWDYIVLQEQSQRPALPPNYVSANVYPPAQTLRNQIRANDSCTKVLFYMTWGRKNGDAMNCGGYPPVCTYEGMQQRLSTSYRELARRNGAIVVPVGMSWRSSIQSNPTYELFDADESHPALSGSYLAAVTFYATMYKRTAVGLNYYGGLPQTDAVRLQNIGSSIALDSLDTWWQNMLSVRADFTHQQTVDTREVRFTNTSRDGLRYRWAFGDTVTSVSSDVNPVHVFRRTGTFTVTLITDNGCDFDTMRKQVNVVDYGACEVPTQRPFTIAGNDVILSWTGSPRPTAQYEVSYRRAVDANWITLPITNQTTATIPAIQRCITYEVRYRSFCNGQFSAYSPVQLVNYLGTPVIRSVTYVSATTCLIVWNPMPNAYYRVQYRPRGTQNWTATPFNLTQNSRLLIGLRARTPYEIRVVARCINDTDPNPVVTETPTENYENTGIIRGCTATNPTPPVLIQTVNIGTRTATIKWRNIPDARGVLLVHGPRNVNSNVWSQTPICNPTDSIVLRSLMPNTKYGFYLQALCSSCVSLSIREKRSERSPVEEFITLATREDEDSFLTEGETLTVYPNPSRGVFTLTGAENYIGQTLKLYDHLGRTIRTLTLTDETVDVSGVASGLYSLQVGDRFVKVWISE